MHGLVSRTFTGAGAHSCYDGRGNQFVPRPGGNDSDRKDWIDIGARLAADVLKRMATSTAESVYVVTFNWRMN
jgi:hypothetical protein